VLVIDYHIIDTFMASYFLGLGFGLKMGWGKVFVILRSLRAFCFCELVRTWEGGCILLLYVGACYVMRGSLFCWV
jgi:hypothetical protein